MTRCVMACRGLWLFDLESAIRDRQSVDICILACMRKGAIIIEAIE